MTFRSYISRSLRCVLTALALLLSLTGGGLAAEPAAASAPSAQTAGAPLNPQDADAARAQRFSVHIEQATRSYKSGDYDHAIEEYQAALQLQPNPLLLFNIAQSHRRAGHSSEALTYFERFLEQAPKSKLAPEVHEYVNALRDNRPTQAVPKPYQPPETRPDNFLGSQAQRLTEFRKQIARASAALEAEKYDDAASAYWVAHSLKPQPIIIFNVAQVYRKAQRFSEALALYERYLREEPRSALTAKVQGYVAEVKERLAEQQSRSDAEAAERMKKASETLTERLAEVQVLDRRIQITQALADERTLDRQPRPLYKRPLLWVLVGTAAAGLIVGISVGVTYSLRLPDTELGKRMLNF